MTSVRAIDSSTIVAAGNAPRREASTLREPKVTASRALITATGLEPGPSRSSISLMPTGEISGCLCLRRVCR